MDDVIYTLEVIGSFAAIIFVAIGVWTLISAGVDTALGSQEPRSGRYYVEVELEPDWQPADRTGDPTAPDDENVIQLKDYQYRRLEK